MKLKHFFQNWSIFYIFYIFQFSLFVFSYAALSKSTDLNYNINDLSNYQTKITFIYKNNIFNLEEYTFKEKTKLVVRSQDYNYDLINFRFNGTYYLIKQNSYKCDLIKNENEEYDSQGALGPLSFFFNYNKKTKNPVLAIGPSAFFYLHLCQNLELVKKDAKIRGINVINYESKNKFDFSGLKNIDLELAVKTGKAFVPIQTKVTFTYKLEQFDLVFDYFNFEPFNDFKTKPYRQISFPIACSHPNEIDETPDFKLTDMMEIEFMDISSKEPTTRTKFFIDKRRKLVRLENDDGSKVLDMKNRILFETDITGKCEIELYSSKSKFSGIKRTFYKNVHLILNIDDIIGYTFVGNSVEDGYLKKKFQKITEHGNLYQKKTLYFEANNTLNMLVYEEIEKDTNKLKQQVTLDISKIRPLEYNEEYREIFTVPNCESNEHLYVHLYSIPFDQDPHLDKKLAYIKNKEDFVVSKLLQSLSDDIGLDLNAFSVSSLEKQASKFVMNSLVLNVENYLDSFEEIEDLEVDVSYLEMDLRECSKKAQLDTENQNDSENEANKYSGFKFCKGLRNECYLITENLDKKQARNTENLCKSYRRKKNKKLVYNFHKLSTLLTDLIENKYSIQIEPGIKFVFTRIRFSSGINFIDNDKLFIQFRDKSRIKKPILELDSSNTDRLISPTDCYTQCINNLNCRSFSFCKHRSFTIEISCQLSDLVLSDEDTSEQSMLKKLFNISSDSSDEDVLEKDSFCQTYNLNYLQHFNPKGKWMMATSSSLKSEYFDSYEECARECYDYNKNEILKCGKLEICSDNKKGSKKFQCNLKLFSYPDEIKLKKNGCEYFKIDNLVDYHQIDLDENDSLKLISVGDTIDSCARNCSQAETCTKFNFCYDKNIAKESFKSEIGYCLAHESKSESAFNPDKNALECMTMMKNDQVYFKEPPYEPNRERYKYVNETDPNGLTKAIFALFIFIAGTLGLILGFIGFCYYEASILPAYQAEKGTWFPRLGICKSRDEEEQVTNVGSVKTVQIMEKIVEEDEPVVSVNEERKSTKPDESEFMDIKL